MKKNLIYSLVLVAGLVITGTVLAQNRHQNKVKSNDQVAQYYCTMYGAHHTYMRQMNDSSYMGNAGTMHNTYMMNHSHYIMNGTTVMPRGHMMNYSENCWYMGN